MVECKNKSTCLSLGTKCKTCKNNTMRNAFVDYYEKALDNPIPETWTAMKYSGPAEQTPGYKCPVCGNYTNPYIMRKNACNHCGYKLT